MVGTCEITPHELSEFLVVRSRDLGNSHPKTLEESLWACSLVVPLLQPTHMVATSLPCLKPSNSWASCNLQKPNSLEWRRPLPPRQPHHPPVLNHHVPTFQHGRTTRRTLHALWCLPPCVCTHCSFCPAALPHLIYLAKALFIFLDTAQRSRSPRRPSQSRPATPPEAASVPVGRLVCSFSP